MKGVGSNDSFITMLRVKDIFRALSPGNINFAHFASNFSPAECFAG